MRIKGAVPVGEKIIATLGGRERTLRRIPHEVAVKLLAEQGLNENTWRDAGGKPIQHLVDRALTGSVDRFDLKIFKRALADKQSINAAVYYEVFRLGQNKETDARTILDVVNNKVDDVVEEIGTNELPGKDPNPGGIGQLRGQLDALKLMQELVIGRGGMGWTGRNNAKFRR